MYVYKENDLTVEQAAQFKGYTSYMRICVEDSACVGIDRNFLLFCANTHEYIFGKPKPNTKSGAVILTMFKNLLRKIDEYELKTYGSKPDATSAGREDVGPADGKITIRRRKRR